MEKAEELDQLYEYGCRLFDAVKKELQNQEEQKYRKELAERLEGKLQELETKLVQEGQNAKKVRELEAKLEEAGEKARQAENSKKRILSEMIQILKRENG